MINDLPKKIKNFRTKYGYSQKQLADKLNVSTSIISGYETGERTPSTDILLSLSYLFNCSTDYLLGKMPTQNQIIINTEGMTNKQITAILNLIETIKESN